MCYEVRVWPHQAAYQTAHNSISAQGCWMAHCALFQSWVEFALKICENYPQESYQSSLDNFLEWMLDNLLLSPAHMTEYLQMNHCTTCIMKRAWNLNKFIDSVCRYFVWVQLYPCRVLRKNITFLLPVRFVKMCILERTPDHAGSFAVQGSLKATNARPKYRCGFEQLFPL